MAPEHRLRIDLATEDRARVMVVSHERSGTHFLMNTLAAAFGYVSNPWIDFDHEQVNINYYATNEVVELFTKLGERRLANTVKSHHQVGFFDDCLATITEMFTVFYIYRDPRDVMKSYHRVVDRLAWAEGPKTASCGAFIRAAPEGHMMRYQTHQHANLLKRWQAHVEGWLAAGERRAGIVPVRFEDLDRDYQRTVGALGQALDLAPRTHDRPSRDENVIAPPDASDAGVEEPAFDTDDLAFFEDQIGATMTRLGYLTRT